MKRHRTFQGLMVAVEEGVPTENGEGAKVTMPDGSEVLVRPFYGEYRDLDASICRAVNDWRVDKWAESGHGGVI